MVTKVVDKIVETLILQHIVFIKYAQRKRVGKRLARLPLIMPFVDWKTTAIKNRFEIELCALD